MNLGNTIVSLNLNDDPPLWQTLSFEKIQVWGDMCQK